jgi:hypothetical protein
MSPKILIFTIIGIPIHLNKKHANNPKQTLCGVALLKLFGFFAGGILNCACVSGAYFHEIINIIQPNEL